MEPLLEIKNLKLRCYVEKNAFHPLNGMNLSVYPGKITAIVGESGSGKSLSALSIMRLLPPYSLEITEGSIEFLGENLCTKSEREMCKIRGKEISMVFQNPLLSLNPTLSIGYQLIEGLCYHTPISRSDARLRGIEILRAVGIPEPERRFDQFPHQLSGGMQQRVMIGMAIACKPKLLIADEPTTALDVTVQIKVLALLKKIQQETGIAILFITHDLALVSQFCDFVGVMHKGSIVEYGPVQEVYHSPRHPHTRHLLESKKKLVSYL